MKKITFTLIICISLLCLKLHSQEKEEPIKLKGVLVTNDYHENMSWIKSKPVALVKKDFTKNALEVKYIQLYFGLKVVDGKQTMTAIHLVNNYKDRDWIFFDEVSYLLGNRKEVKQGKGKVFKIKDDDTRRNVNNGVSEYSDVLAIGEAKEFIKYVLENDDTGLNIRYLDTSKNLYREVEVPGGTKKIKKHFQALIDAYNKINEAYSLNQEF